MCIHCYKYIYTYLQYILYTEKKVDLYTNDQFEYHAGIKPVFQKARVSCQSILQEMFSNIKHPLECCFQDVTFLCCRNSALATKHTIYTVHMKYIKTCNKMASTYNLNIFFQVAAATGIHICHWCKQKIYIYVDMNMYFYCMLYTMGFLHHHDQCFFHHVGLPEFC